MKASEVLELDKTNIIRTAKMLEVYLLNSRDDERKRALYVDFVNMIIDVLSNDIRLVREQERGIEKEFEQL